MTTQLHKPYTPATRHLGAMKTFQKASPYIKLTFSSIYPPVAPLTWERARLGPSCHTHNMACMQLGTFPSRYEPATPISMPLFQGQRPGHWLEHHDTFRIEI